MLRHRGNVHHKGQKKPTQRKTATLTADDTVVEETRIVAASDLAIPTNATIIPAQFVTTADGEISAVEVDHIDGVDNNTHQIVFISENEAVYVAQE